MVKSITSAKNFVKTFVLSALLWGFAATLALSPLEAFPQQKPAVPTVHNTKLDEKLLKFCVNEQEITMIEEFTNNVYREYGTYLGSATIQQNIDYNMFLEFLNGNIEILKKFDEEAYNKIDRDAMKQVVEKSEPIKQWLNENFFNAYNEPFGQFDHQPDAEEVSQALDKYVNEDPNNLFNRELVDVNYTMQNQIFKNTQESIGNYSNRIQKYSDYISNQVFGADYLLFYNLLNFVGLNSDYLSRARKNLAYYVHEIRPGVQVNN